MTKILILLVFVVGVYLELSESTSINCDYKTENWIFIKNVYYCSITNDPNIATRESATITSISGNHQSGKTNSNVEGFKVSSKTCHYFPRGLETFYENIKAIHILSSNLKEVHQEDLKPFSKLIEIRFYVNLLEVLEEGLFDFNLDLEWISFFANKIVHIEPNIFDHLSKLSYLFLDSNTCIDTNAQNSISGVKNVIQTAKSQCINFEFSSLKKKLEILEKDSKTLNYNELREKLSTFEKSFKASKFSNFRPLNYKLETFKKPKFEDDILTKLDSMNDTMTKISMETKDLKSSQFSFSEVKGSIDGFEATLNALKTGQSSIVGSINQVCTKESLSQVKDIQGNILDSVSDIHKSFVKNEIDFRNYQSYFNTSIDNLQESTKKSFNSLDSKVTNLKTSQDDLKISIGDIEATLSGLKSSQNEVRLSINKIRSSQNDVKVLMDEIKVHNDNNAEDKFKLFSDEIKGHQKDIESQLAEFEEKFDYIEKGLTNTRHKITVTIDEKMKGIEKRFMKKFEDVLEEKLRKILDEKLGSSLGSK